MSVSLSVHKGECSQVTKFEQINVLGGVHMWQEGSEVAMRWGGDVARTSIRKKAVGLQLKDFLTPLTSHIRFPLFFIWLYIIIID